MKSTSFSLLLATSALYPLIAHAVVGLGGCTRTSIPSLSTIFYWNPELEEQCVLIDCGGGRAPPKTNVPGCPGYVGMETVTPVGWPDEPTPVPTKIALPKPSGLDDKPKITGGSETPEGDEGDLEEEEDTRYPTGLPTLRPITPMAPPKKNSTNVEAPGHNDTIPNLNDESGAERATGSLGFMWAAGMGFAGAVAIMM